MTFSIETGVPVLTVFLQGLCAPACSAVYRISVRRRKSGGGGRDDPLSEGKDPAAYSVFCHWNQLCLFCSRVWIFRSRTVFLRKQDDVCKDQRYSHDPVRYLSDGDPGTSESCRPGTQDSFPPGPVHNESAGSACFWIYVQLCMDALCGTGAGKRAPDGLDGGFPGDGLSADRRLYGGICSPVSGRRSVYRYGTQFFPAPSEDCAVFCKGTV